MATANDEMEDTSHLLTLPSEIIEKTLSYLTYDEASNYRTVCKTFDRQCQQHLNQGFSNAEKLQSIIYKEIKAKLPRRESERRSHPLARHMDLLAALETRLSLLAMTYIKYIEVSSCCFIPGKVLDEIFRILYRIRNDPTPPRPHELLTELRDISSMAMEHFEEKIIPVLKARMRKNQPPSEADLCGALLPLAYINPPMASPSTTQVPAPALSPALYSPMQHLRVPNMRMEMGQLRSTIRVTSSTVIFLRKEVSDYKATVSDQHRKMLEQDKKIAGLGHTIGQMKTKFADQEKTMADLRNSVLRMEAKYSEKDKCDRSSYTTSLGHLEGVDNRELGAACSSKSVSVPVNATERLMCDDETDHPLGMRTRNKRKMLVGRPETSTGDSTSTRRKGKKLKT